MDTKDKKSAGSPETTENKKLQRLFGYGEKRIYRPFDMTILEFCRQKSLELSGDDEWKKDIRTGFTKRLKTLRFFEKLFFTDANNSDYRFKRVSDDVNRSSNGKGAIVINLPWEAIPLLWAYSETQVKAYNNKNKLPSIERKNQQLNAYMGSLKNEEGELFSLFRDTNPLYQQLLFRDFAFDLLPERILSLVTSLLLVPIKQRGAMLYALIQMLDTLISQNLKTIFCDQNLNDSESCNSKLDEIQKVLENSLNLPKSIKELFTNLESDRLASSESSIIKIDDKQYETCGLNISHTLNAEEIELLQPLLAYLSNGHNEEYKKRDSAKITGKEICAEKDNENLEDAARGAYDKYRALNQDEKIIKDANNFRKYDDLFKLLGNRSVEGERDKSVFTHLQIGVYIKLLTALHLPIGIPDKLLSIENVPLSLQYPLLNIESAVHEAIENIIESLADSLKWKYDVDTYLHEINELDFAGCSSEEKSGNCIYARYFNMQANKYIKKSIDFLSLIEHEIFFNDTTYQKTIESIKKQISDLPEDSNIISNFIEKLEEANLYVIDGIASYCEEQHFSDNIVTRDYLIGQGYYLPIFHILFDSKTNYNVYSLWNQRHDFLTTLANLSRFFSFFMQVYSYKCSDNIAKQIIEDTKVYEIQKNAVLDRLSKNIEESKKKDTLSEIKKLIGEIYVEIYDKYITITDLEESTSNL